MRKRVYIALAIVLVMLAGVIAWQVRQASREREPVYQGKPLSVWLEVLYEARAGPNQAGRSTAEQAVRHIGTNALPVLTERFRAHDTRLKQLMVTWMNRQNFLPFHLKSANRRRYEAVMGCEALGALAIPNLVDTLTNNSSPSVREAAAWELGCVGPEARVAAVALFRATKDTDPGVRSRAFWALRMILPDPQLTIPILVAGLDDGVPSARLSAALTLRKYGPEAKTAVPVLLRLLTMNNAASMEQQRANAAARVALEAIDPAAAAKAGVK